jgi:hypothetical protein
VAYPLIAIDAMQTYKSLSKKRVMLGTQPILQSILYKLTWHPK